MTDVVVASLSSSVMPALCRHPPGSKPRCGGLERRGCRDRPDTNTITIG